MEHGPHLSQGEPLNTLAMPNDLPLYASHSCRAVRRLALSLSLGQSAHASLMRNSSRVCVHAQYISSCRAIAYGTLLCNRVSRNRYNERGHCCQRMYVIILYKFRRGIKQLLRSMLTPFDRVEVDTLLHEFPQRAQLAEEGNALFDSLQDVVDL